MINSKVYGTIISLNCILKTDCLISGEVLISILGQLIEYYTDKIFTEKFGCPNTNFGPLH